MIKALIFDMDGVLCDSEAFIAEAACRMFQTVYATAVKPSDFKPFVGTGEDRFLEGVATQYNIRLVFPRDKETTYKFYADCVKDRLQPVPGVTDFIRRSAAAGLKLAVATSSDRFKMKVNLNAIGLGETTFNALVTGCDVQRKKPAPDIFLKAAEILGVMPQECVVFEDAISGVQAAKAAGARCIGVTTSFSGEHLKAAGADKVISDFYEKEFGGAK